METSNREKGLQNIAQAYLDLKDGKAMCVMVVVRGDELEIHSGNATASESLQMISRANSVIAQELADTLDALVQLRQEEE